MLKPYSFFESAKFSTALRNGLSDDERAVRRNSDLFRNVNFAKFWWPSEKIYDDRRWVYIKNRNINEFLADRNVGYQR